MSGCGSHHVLGSQYIYPVMHALARVAQQRCLIERDLQRAAARACCSGRTRSSQRQRRRCSAALAHAQQVLDVSDEDLDACREQYRAGSRALHDVRSGA